MSVFTSPNIFSFEIEFRTSFTFVSAMLDLNWDETSFDSSQLSFKLDQLFGPPDDDDVTVVASASDLAQTQGVLSSFVLLKYRYKNFQALSTCLFSSRHLARTTRDEATPQAASS